MSWRDDLSQTADEGGHNQIRQMLSRLQNTSNLDRVAVSGLPSELIDHAVVAYVMAGSVPPSPSLVTQQKPRLREMGAGLFMGERFRFRAQ